MTRTNASVFARGLLLGASIACGVIAQADVKVVSHVHSVVMGRARPDLQVTTYYKGDLMRTDVNDLVTIFDAKTGNVLVVNPKSKTYSDVGDNDALADMKIEASAKVSSSDEHKKIASHDTTKYVAAIHMTMTENSMTQDVDMQMDIWACPDLKSPFVKAHLLRSMGQMLNGMNVTGMAAFAAEMEKVSGYPLAQTLTMDKLPGMPSNMGGGTGPMVKFESTADSVDENALPDILFKIPSDFKKVKPSDLGKRKRG